MIRKINNVFYPPIPYHSGADSSSTSSLLITALSSVSVDSGVFSVGDGFRIKSLFRKTTSDTTTFKVFLYWNTGTTYDANAVKLAEVSVGGSTSAVGIERHIFPFTTFGPISNFVDVLDPNSSNESDIGLQSPISVGGASYNYFDPGYYLACAQRIGISKTPDTILCSYLYIDF